MRRGRETPKMPLRRQSVTDGSPSDRTRARVVQRELPLESGTLAAPGRPPSARGRPPRSTTRAITFGIRDARRHTVSHLSAVLLPVPIAAVSLDPKAAHRWRQGDRR
ncbi:hypothetical protein GCM10018775_81840 [Streptomyces umbrinus]|nr:hypothetical protein GCM10018775_81840 [Streptomyces umbrinus]